MMVGFMENHDVDVYRICIPVMEHVHVTHDIIRLKHVFRNASLRAFWRELPATLTDNEE